ncbi:MAG: DUF1585 domain-containing protein, partial [Planctomycetaceae bacterium]|nr:DUF1585 domain-containing protein [Planctomycetaceae bacterium]
GIGPDPTVDSSGSLPDGRQFTNSDQFKQLLRDDRDKFATAFIEHLCTYGLRRVLTVDDQNDILTIVEEAKKHNYGLRDTIRAVALSDLMKKR